MRSDKVRLLVFSLFLMLLIVFGLIYQPVDAMSRPADRGNATGQTRNAQVSPAQNPLGQQKR